MIARFVCWWRGAHQWVYESTPASEADTSGNTRGARRCEYCDVYEDLR